MKSRLKDMTDCNWLEVRMLKSVLIKMIESELDRDIASLNIRASSSTSNGMQIDPLHAGSPIRYATVS